MAPTGALQEPSLTRSWLSPEPRLMVVGLSRLQTHGISRLALVPHGVSPISDRPGQGGSDILYSVFCILYFPPRRFGVTDKNGKSLPFARGAFP